MKTLIFFLFFAFTSTAFAACELSLEAAALQPPASLPRNLKVQCDDGSYGTGTIDILGHVRATIFPSPTSHNHFPRDYVGDVGPDGNVDLQKISP